MATKSAPLTLHDRYEALTIALRGLELLSLDDLWSEAVQSGDSVAPSIGKQMLGHLELIGERSTWLERIASDNREELNASWPALRDAWYPSREAEIKTLDAWITEYGGFGNAVAATALRLRAACSRESESLSRRLREFEDQGQTTDDIDVDTRVLVAVAVTGLLVAAIMPVVIVALAAPPITAASLTGIGVLAGAMAGIAGGALIRAKERRQAPPPTAPPTG